MSKNKKTGLSKQQKKNAERLQAALDQDDADALAVAKGLGDAAKAGDEEELARLSNIVQKRGWLKG